MKPTKPEDYKINHQHGDAELRELKKLWNYYNSAQNYDRKRRDQVVPYILKRKDELRTMSEEELRQTKRKHRLDQLSQDERFKGETEMDVGREYDCDCGTQSHAHHINCPQHPCNHGGE